MPAALFLLWALLFFPFKAIYHSKKCSVQRGSCHQGRHKWKKKKTIYMLFFSVFSSCRAVRWQNLYSRWWEQEGMFSIPEGGGLFIPALDVSWPATLRVNSHQPCLIRLQLVCSERAVCLGRWEQTIERWCRSNEGSNSGPPKNVHFKWTKKLEADWKTVAVFVIWTFRCMDGAFGFKKEANQTLVLYGLAGSEYGK